ncbi:hypothetical protein EMCRGX_G025620 [Ephydatia muelleri]
MQYDKTRRSSSQRNCKLRCRVKHKVLELVSTTYCNHKVFWRGHAMVALLWATWMNWSGKEDTILVILE